MSYAQELRKRLAQLEQAHQLLIQHHDSTRELELRHIGGLHQLRDAHLRKQHEAELANQSEYNARSEREVRKRHALESKQQPKSLKQREAQIRREFLEACKQQTREYKVQKQQLALAQQPVMPPAPFTSSAAVNGMVTTTTSVSTNSKERLKQDLKRAKEEQHRKLALLGEQYEQAIQEMMQTQGVSVNLPTPHALLIEVFCTCDAFSHSYDLTSRKRRN